MFESAVLHVVPDQRRRNILVLPLAVVSHVLVLGTVLTVQLLAVEELATPVEFCCSGMVPHTPPVPQGPPAPPAGGERRQPRREPVAQPAAVPDAVPAPPERAEPAAGTGVPYGLEPEGGTAPGDGGGDGDGAVSPSPEPAGPPKAPAAYEIRGEVAPPVAVARVRPVYPPAARIAGRQGAVRVRVVIGVDGAVGAVEVVEDGVGFGCADAALAAIRQWRFRPATLRGRPVAVYMEVTVMFTLARS